MNKDNLTKKKADKLFPLLCECLENIVSVSVKIKSISRSGVLQRPTGRVNGGTEVMGIGLPDLLQS